MFQNLIRFFCYIRAFCHDMYVPRDIISRFKKIFIDTPAFEYLARARRWYPPSCYLPRTHTVNATYHAIFVAPRCFLIFHLFPSLRLTYSFHLQTFGLCLTGAPHHRYRCFARTYLLFYICLLRSVSIRLLHPLVLASSHF